MRTIGAMILLACLTVGAGGSEPQTTPPSPEAVELRAAPDRVAVRATGIHRLLVTALNADGFEIDRTRDAAHASDHPDVAQVNAEGVIRGLKPGTATITSKWGGLEVATPVTVGTAPDESRLSFRNDILPLLSRAGCNAGECHAKPDGQKGFKLSVFAYDPQSDYREIVKDARGRRVFPAAPAQSLLLRKPTMAIEHGGRLRFETGSPPYRTLHKWIESGMPYAQPDEPKLTGLEAIPGERLYKKNATQQLLVRASYSDGSFRDVTHLAQYDSKDDEIVEVDDNGFMKVGARTGEGFVIARFMGLVDFTRVTVPSERKLPESMYASLQENNFIDGHVHARLKKLGLFPSELCDDAAFIRRASLDAIGALPNPPQVKAFLNDDDPDKRNALIDRLLADPRYADYWATKWADLIRPNPARVGVKSVYMFDLWIRDRLRENEPYDRFVREIVTAQGNTHRYGPAVVYRDRRQPEEVTAMISRIFLGVRIECAKCHHHPNEKWSQKDFYQLAAFFGEIKHKGTGISPPISGGSESIYHGPGGAVKHPVTREVMKPKPPDGPYAQIQPGQDPREALANWMCDPANPFFARAIVNRIWSEIMGRGLVDPVDDFRASNPPTNGPLLEALAEDFVANGYDLKRLIRTIMRSRTYQAGSEPNEYNIADAQNFSRSYRRRLPAEVLLDAVSNVTGTEDSFNGLPAGARAIETWSNNIQSRFLDTFGRPDSSEDCTCDRDPKSSLVQALHLMNSETIQEKISFAEGRAARLAKDENLSAKDIVSEIYLAALSRYPTDEELGVAAKFLFTAPGATRQTATEDVMWSLINSAEFVFNH